MKTGALHRKTANISFAEIRFDFVRYILGACARTKIHSTDGAEKACADVGVLFRSCVRVCVRSAFTQVATNNGYSDGLAVTATYRVREPHQLSSIDVRFVAGVQLTCA